MLPLAGDLENTQKKLLADNTTDENLKKKQLLEIDDALQKLSAATSCLRELNSLNKELSHSAQTIRTLSSSLYKS